MLKPFTVAALVIFTSAVFCLAQEPLPNDSTQATPSARATLKLEVNYNPATSRAYIDIRGLEAKPAWVWFTRFVRIPGWRLPHGALPIRAVRLEPQFNGETTEVTVTLLRGQRSVTEQEELVGKVRLDLGEHRILNELEAFGIEPFDIAVTDVASLMPSQPVFDIRVSAIEIADVKAENVPLPAYRIKFKNLTTKSILALKLDTADGESALFQGEEGRPLIEPGEVHEHYIPVVRAVQRGAEVVPGSAEVNTIIISSVVFGDGTFDGDAGPACSFESMLPGRTLWLKQAIALLEKQIEVSDASVDPAAKQFKERVSTLNPESTLAEKQRSPAVSTSCPPPTSFAVKMSFQLQRQILLRELDQIISTRPVPPVNFKSWLQDKRDRYAAWLSRLETRGQ
jgi:hypothetical protein